MLEKLQSALNALNTQRAQITGAGWWLQHCWLVQVKPGGTARTNTKYWQVRSRQPIFAGKTLKHLKPDEVEDYRAAIERGRQLQQLDRQIAKLQQRLSQLLPAANTVSDSSVSPLQETSLPPSMLPIDACRQPMQAQSLNSVQFTTLAEQERLVQEVLANSQALRASLGQSLAKGKRLGERNVNLRKGHPRVSTENG